MTASAPHLAGYTPETHYDCPNCGLLARVIYRQTGANVDKENPHSFVGMWRETRFGGGTVVDSVGHQMNGYPYGQVCGWQLPPEASGDPAHFVDRLYQNMLPYWIRQKAKHIGGLNAAKFLAGPWCMTIKAREVDAPPITLMVQPYAMCFVIKNGRLPNLRTEPYQFSADEQDTLAEEFLTRIDAVLGDV